MSRLGRGLSFGRSQVARLKEPSRQALGAAGRRAAAGSRAALAKAQDPRVLSFVTGEALPASLAALKKQLPKGHVVYLTGTSRAVLQRHHRETPGTALKGYRAGGQVHIALTGPPQKAPKAPKAAKPPTRSKAPDRIHLAPDLVAKVKARGYNTIHDVAFTQASAVKIRDAKWPDASVGRGASGGAVSHFVAS